MTALEAIASARRRRNQAQMVPVQGTAWWCGLALGGRVFEFKKDLKGWLQTVVAAKERGDEQFFDSVLADVFMYCNIRPGQGHRPTSFKFVENSTWTDNRTWSTSLAAFVPGTAGPEAGWWRFSYDRLLRGPGIVFDLARFTEMCQDRFRGVWRPRLLSGKCAAPGCSQPAVDVHHVEPTHMQIRDMCFALLRDVDVERIRADIVSLTRSHHPVLPSDAPATQEYDRLTSTGRFEALCKTHHRDQHRKEIVP